MNFYKKSDKYSMYTIFLNMLIWLLVQSCFAADNEHRVLSPVVLENRQLVLIHSIYNKDIDRTRAILEVGAKPQQGMLIKCRTVAQARMLVAHGLSIKKEDELYGFLPAQMAFEADPDLLTYFLEQVPLSLANRYGRDTYGRLLEGVIEVALENITKDELRFFQKLQILIDHNCYYDHKKMMGAIACYNDTALGNDREGVKRIFKSIIIDNEPKKRTNMLPLLQQRARSGFSSRDTKRLAFINLQHRYEQEVRQHEEKQRQEAIEKNMGTVSSFFYILYDIRSGDTSL
jgi:hypothetical protein